MSASCPADGAADGVCGQNVARTRYASNEFCASVGVLCPCVMCPHSPVPLMGDWLSLLLAQPCLAAAAM